MVTAVAVMTAMMVGSALPAFAAHNSFAAKGTPNEKACQGVVIGGLAHSKNEAGPFTPPIAAELTGRSSVKEYTKSVREGEIGATHPVTGETLSCPKDQNES